VKLAPYVVVEVVVDEEQETDKDVFLVFLGPGPMLDQLMKVLRDRGLRFTEAVNEREAVIRCRFTPPPPKH
jgi:hypothetical protein